MQTTAPQNLRDQLSSIFLERTRRNPRYSLRRFAHHLEIDPSALSKILKGRRPVGTRLHQKLASKLELSPSAPAHTDRFSPIDDDHFELLANWYHFAILELTRVRDFQPKATWVAHRLGIAVVEVTQAVDRLERVGLMEVHPDEWRLTGTGHNAIGNDHYSKSAFRVLQRELLEQAIRKLEELPFSERDHSSMTLAIREKDIPRAKQEITRFRRRFSQTLENRVVPDRVFNLSIAFYPLDEKTKETPS